MVPCLLIYDIPDRCEVRNPSNRLRTRAVRINLSCWVIMEQDIPYSMLSSLREAGASWHIVKFDANERERLCLMAIDTIRKEVREAAERVQEAEAELADDESTVDYRRARQRAARAIRRFRKLVADYRQAAQRFGIEHARLDLTGSLTLVEAIDTSFQRRCSLLKKAQLALGHDPVARASSQDQIPAVLLADRLQDAGHDELAEEIRAEFFAVEVG